jgi:hypothetical protein
MGYIELRLHWLSGAYAFCAMRRSVSFLEWAEENNAEQLNKVNWLNQSKALYVLVYFRYKLAVSIQFNSAISLVF